MGRYVGDAHYVEYRFHHDIDVRCYLPIQSGWVAPRPDDIKAALVEGDFMDVARWIDVVAAGQRIGLGKQSRLMMMRYLSGKTQMPYQAWFVLIELSFPGRMLRPAGAAAPGGALVGTESAFIGA